MGLHYRILSFFLVGLFACQPQQEPPPANSYDILIYGGTSAAITAAIQSIKMDKTVAIVCPETHLGGMTAGGLGWTDAGKKFVVGGLSRDFYHRVWEYYQDSSTWKWQDKESYDNRAQNGRAIDDETQTMWTFEPHVATQVYEDLVEEYQIPVFRDQWLDRDNGIRKEGGKIQSIRMLSGETYHADVFMDVTYEGDLMAAAGISYFVGRESNEQHNETLNGVQAKNAVSHQFTLDVDPYVVPGDPKSGLLARISAEPPGPDGSQDHRMQAYCYRMCLTQVSENRVPFPKPSGYDSTQYELMLRLLQAGWKKVFNKFDPLPNKKTDTNNHGPFSTDNIGMNYDYPEASYERREEILKEHELYQKGWLYFMANDPRVPQDIQEEFAKWGFAKDEFVDNGNWPHQIYVREARRLVGDFVVTERHLRRLDPTLRSIGMGSYNMDSHNVMRYVNADGWVKNEGDIQINPGGPYPIDVGAILPKKAECQNLLVPVCVSTSHIAYGSIRMEPVFMILGQSAATLAAMAIDKDMAVQEVPYEELKEKLLADGQVLETSSSP